MKERKVRRKQKLGSYPFVSVVFSITVALCVLGLLGWIVLHSFRLSTQIQESIEIQVFLNKNIAQSDINKIRSIIATKPYTLVKDEQPQIELITKTQATQQFIEDTGEDFKDFLGESPLRDLLIVKVYSEYQSLSNLLQVKSEIEAIRGVFEVEYEENLIESINENLTKISIILLGMTIFAILVVIILINNTIKLALFSQRFLIRSMQLVGATSTFIQRPFIFRAIPYGFIAGILANIIIYVFTLSLNIVITDLEKLQDTKGFLFLFCFICITGIMVGYLSSLRAVRKYLKMSLDELY